MQSMLGKKQTALRWMASLGESSGQTTRISNSLAGNGKKNMMISAHLHALPLVPLLAALLLASKQPHPRRISRRTWVLLERNKRVPG